MENPYFNATNYSNYIVGSNFIAAQLIGTSGIISFNYPYTVYFTVIGGGGGGGSSGAGDVDDPPSYPSGGGGGSAGFGQLSFTVDPSYNYNYSIGIGGIGGIGATPSNTNQCSGASGTNTIVTTPIGQIRASGGSGGKGYMDNGSVVGGSKGTLTYPPSITPLIDGSGGNGGNGFNNSDGSTLGYGTNGHDISLSTIQIYPEHFIFVCGGGGGGDAHQRDLSFSDYGGGGGKPGTGGIHGGSPTGNGGNGENYGGGGGGAGQPGSTTSNYSNYWRYYYNDGGRGADGAIFIFFYAEINGCVWNPALANLTTIWSRASDACVDLSGAVLPNGQPMTYDDLSEKRKAVIFQYKNNGAGFSKKQHYSRLARGLGRQRGQTFATQSETYTNPNTHNLVVDNSAVLICPGVTKNWALTNENDTPGPLRRITNYPTVPLTNYIVRRTYLAGGTKWPQYAWAPGMSGFPIGKAGHNK